MTDHPRDEFDRVPESSARQGVHRERLIPARSSGLGLKITVGILALLIGLGAYFILPRLGFGGGGDDAASVSSPSSAGAAIDASASGDPSAKASGGSAGSPGSDATAAPDGGSSSAASAEASDDADPAGDADRTQAVNVLNGTGTPGLATVAASRLASTGWTSVLPGNWAGAPLDASVVFYNGEAQRVGAEVVAADLGITNLVDSPDISPDISVVLGPEFQ